MRPQLMRIREDSVAGVDGTGKFLILNGVIRPFELFDLEYI